MNRSSKSAAASSTSCTRSSSATSSYQNQSRATTDTIEVFNHIKNKKNQRGQPRQAQTHSLDIQDVAREGEDLKLEKDVENGANLHSRPVDHEFDLEWDDILLFGNDHDFEMAPEIGVADLPRQRQGIHVESANQSTELYRSEIDKQKQNEISVDTGIAGKKRSKAGGLRDETSKPNKKNSTSSSSASSTLDLTLYGKPAQIAAELIYFSLSNYLKIPIKSDAILFLETLNSGIQTDNDTRSYMVSLIEFQVIVNCLEQIISKNAKTESFNDETNLVRENKSPLMKAIEIILFIRGHFKKFKFYSKDWIELFPIAKSRKSSWEDIVTKSLSAISEDLLIADLHKLQAEPFVLYLQTMLTNRNFREKVSLKLLSSEDQVEDCTVGAIAVIIYVFCYWQENCRSFQSKLTENSTLEKEEDFLSKLAEDMEKMRISLKCLSVKRKGGNSTVASLDGNMPMQVIRNIQNTSFPYKFSAIEKLQSKYGVKLKEIISIAHVLDSTMKRSNSTVTAATNTADCNKTNSQSWSMTEDQLLLLGVAVHGIGKWCYIRDECPGLRLRTSPQMNQRFFRLGRRRLFSLLGEQEASSEAAVTSLDVGKRFCTGDEVREFMKIHSRLQLFIVDKYFDETTLWFQTALRTIFGPSDSWEGTDNAKQVQNQHVDGRRNSGRPSTKRDGDSLPFVSELECLIQPNNLVGQRARIEYETWVDLMVTSTSKPTSAIAVTTNEFSDDCQSNHQIVNEDVINDNEFSAWELEALTNFISAKDKVNSLLKR